MDRTDIQITTALSSLRAHTRPHGGKCGGEGDGGLEVHEHLHTSRAALQRHLQPPCGQRRAHSYHPGRHPPPGPPAVPGEQSSGGAAGVCGLPWLLQRPAPRQPQTPPLSRSDLQVDGMGHPHDSGDRVRQSHLAQVVLQPRNGARNGPRPGRTAAAAAQPAPTLVLCTLTVAVWLLAARAISIRHKAPAAALRVPATPRACSKRSAACNTLAKRKPAEKHQPDGAVPASTRAQVSGSPRRWISRSD